MAWVKRFLKVSLGIILLAVVWLGSPGLAGPLTDRIQGFPEWPQKLPGQSVQGDLVYPHWFEGTWNVTTTLVDLVAPLAPDIVTPGFVGNQADLNRSIAFQARFIPSLSATARSLVPHLPRAMVGQGQDDIVADRAFNGLNLANASLGTEPSQPAPILAVKVDPQNPNRQITLLRNDRQLVSTVIARATETPADNQFVTTEVFRQEFRGIPQPYFNDVETTTAYRYQPGQIPELQAEQVTAIYLSPQDPDYFRANDRPIALYRYKLQLRRSQPSTQ